jgi:hypothetical protein
VDGNVFLDFNAGIAVSSTGLRLFSEAVAEIGKQGSSR